MTSTVSLAPNAVLESLNGPEMMMGSEFSVPQPKRSRSIYGDKERQETSMYPNVTLTI